MYKNIKLALVIILSATFIFLIAGLNENLKPIGCESGIASGSCHNFVVVNSVISNNIESDKNTNIVSLTQINQKSFNKRNFDKIIAPGYEVFYRLYSKGNNQFSEKGAELQIRKNLPLNDNVGFHTCSDKTSKCPPVVAMKKYAGSLPNISYAVVNGNKIIEKFELSNKQSDGYNKAFAIDTKAKAIFIKNTATRDTSLIDNVLKFFDKKNKSTSSTNLRIKLLTNNQIKDEIYTSEGIWRADNKTQTISYKPSYENDDNFSYHIYADEINFSPKRIFFFFGLLPSLLIGAFLFYLYAKQGSRNSESNAINLYLYCGLSLLLLIRLYFALAVTSLYVNRFPSVFLALLALWIVPTVICIYSTSAINRRQLYIKSRKAVFFFPILLIVLSGCLVILLNGFLPTSGQVSAMTFVTLPIKEIISNPSFFTIKTHAQFVLELTIIVCIAIYPLLLKPIKLFSLLIRNISSRSSYEFFIAFLSSRVFFLLLLTLLMTILALLSDNAKHTARDKLPFAMMLCLMVPILVTRFFDEYASQTAKILLFIVTIVLMLTALVNDTGSILYIFSLVVAILIILKKHEVYQSNLFKILHVTASTLVVLFLIGVVSFKYLSLSTLENNHKYIDKAQVSNVLGLNICQLPSNIGVQEFRLGTTQKDVIQSKKITDDAKCAEAQSKPIKTIADLDRCVRFCGLSNSDARLFSWINENPYDVILTKAPYGRLQELSRVRSYSIPKSIFFGDGGFYPYEYTEKGKLDGAMFEHIGGLLFVKAFGIAGILMLLGTYVLIILSISKGNYAGKIFVTTLAIVSGYILLQSLNVFPLIGHNLPLMVVSSFAKDFLPIIMGLFILLCLKKQTDNY